MVGRGHSCHHPQPAYLTSTQALRKEGGNSFTDSHLCLHVPQSIQVHKPAFQCPFLIPSTFLSLRTPPFFLFFLAPSDEAQGLTCAMQVRHH